MNKLSEPIIVEQSFEDSTETVWKAITEHEQMIQWFFDNIPDFKAEAGFETQFEVDAGERRFNHLWKIIEAVPGRKIVYDWRYEQYSGAGTVTFELLQDGDGSRLRVTNEGIETFTADIPEFERESCVGGWKFFIQGNLKNYLEAAQ